MKKNNNLLESEWYKWLSIGYWFLIANTCFLLSVSPIVILLLLIGEKVFSEGIIYFTMASLFVGPSMTALLSTTAKYQREKSMTILCDYIKFYRLSFWQSLVFYGAQSAIGIIIIKYIEIISYQSNSLLMKLPLLLVMIIMTTVGTFIYPIISRFNLASLDVLRLSIYYALFKYKKTLINISCLFLAIVICIKGNLFLAVVTPAILSYLIMFNLKSVLLEIEENLKSEVSPRD